MKYLRANPYAQTFILVSATPKEEIEHILRVLGLEGCFSAVFGAPTSKKEGIRRTLNLHNIGPQDCLMIGDVRSDMEAAYFNEVPFVLRRHWLNHSLFSDYDGPSIQDFVKL